MNGGRLDRLFVSFTHCHMDCQQLVTRTVQHSIDIGVNAAGVVTPIFDLQGSSCVDDPSNILTSVLFFPFSGTSEYEVCGDMDLPVCIVR